MFSLNSFFFFACVFLTINEGYRKNVTHILNMCLVSLIIFRVFNILFLWILLLLLLLFWLKVQAIWEVLQLQILCYSVIDLSLLSSFLLICVSFSSLKLQSCYSHISWFFIRFYDLFYPPWVGQDNSRDLKTLVFLSLFHFNFFKKK